MKPRIIVCGLDRTGYTIFCLLRQQGAVVVGIHDRPILSEPSIIVGDLQAEETLVKASIRFAEAIVLSGSGDALNLAILTQARLLNPNIRVINRLFNHSLGERLDRVLPNHTSMSVSAMAAPVFAFAALGNEAIGQLHLFNQTWPIQEVLVTPNHPWQGRGLRELWDDRSRMLIYYLPIDSQTNLVSAVNNGDKLQVGDRLIIGTQPSIRTVSKPWQQRLRKQLTNLWQVLQHSQSMILVTIVLCLTILGATATYLWANPQVRIADALYFSVGMITGAGGQEAVAEKAADSIKIFTVIMMLVGAGVVGICYALLNDLVLGTRFRRFWNTPPIPSRHHYIICGLGGIGIQAAQHLQTQGHEVVVIERDSNNRFLQSAQAFGIPVIQADATVPETLQLANVEGAEALLAVTSNDTVNLEIALSARALHAQLAVVMRNQDSNFGLKIQQVFGLTAVLSPTELAAPAFAAAALGGRILGSGMTADSLWVALASVITLEHPFCGLQVKEAAMDADFVPLYLETSCQTIHGWELLETSLCPSDTLYLTMPASQIARLWRTLPYRSMVGRSEESVSL